MKSVISMKNILIILFLISGLSITFAQETPFSMSTEKLMQNDMMNQMNRSQLLEGKTVLMGNTVEPDHYYLGPGDILSYQNLANSTTQEMITVTPENTIYVPRTGVISVKNMTLAEARDSVYSLVKRKNENAVVFISLYKPRTIMFSIKGNVLVPGTYTIPASFKISSAINMANQYNNGDKISNEMSMFFMNYDEKMRNIQKSYAGTGISPLSSYSTRNILVIHGDGTSQIADLEKSKALNNTDFDPYLREGDEITIPFSNKEFDVISISGAVFRPAVVSFKNGDKASLLLKMGYGLRDDADTDNIKLIIPGDFGDKNEFNLKVDRKMDLIGKDYNLVPGSTIIVGRKKKRTNQTQGIVSIIGNVNKEGSYLIKPDRTKLTEVINMAGGFTNEAYLPQAYILRRDVNELGLEDERRRVWNEFKFSDLTMEDTLRYFIQQWNRKPFVSCDFVKLFKDGDSTQNIELQGGDIIVIPSNPMVVYVYGLVNNPGYVPYEPGKDMYWYIERAGGFAEGADDGRSRIIRGRNRVWIEGSDDVPVYAGDEIFVPAPPDLPPASELAKYSAYASMFATATVIFNIVVNLLTK